MEQENLIDEEIVDRHNFVKNVEKFTQESDLSKATDKCVNTLNLSITIFAEYLPNLRLVHLYVESPLISEGNTHFIQDNNGTIKLHSPNIRIHLSGISVCDRTSFNVDFSSNEKKTVQCCYGRFITKPPSSLSGTSAAEIVHHPVKKCENVLKSLFPFTQIPVQLEERKLYNLHCRSCGNNLYENLYFEKIRPLPTHKWEERVDDFFCHPPDPRIASTNSSSDMDVRPPEQELENKIRRFKINDRISIFDMLSHPDPKHCFYGPCFWLINSKIIQDKTIVDSKAVLCKNCNEAIGIMQTKNAVKLWNSTIFWSNEGKRSTSKQDDFIRILFSLVREAEDKLFRSKILVISYPSNSQTLFHCWESEAQIYSRQFLYDFQRDNREDDNGKVDVTIEKTRAMKFLVGSIPNTIIFKAEVDSDVVVVEMLDSILNAGLKYSIQGPSNITIPAPFPFNGSSPFRQVFFPY